MFGREGLDQVWVGERVEGRRKLTDRISEWKLSMDRFVVFLFFLFCFVAYAYK